MRGWGGWSAALLASLLAVSPVAAQLPTGAASIQFVGEANSRTLNGQAANGATTPAARQPHTTASAGYVADPRDSRSIRLVAGEQVAGERALAPPAARWSPRSQAAASLPAPKQPTRSAANADPFDDPFGDQLKESRVPTSSAFAVQLQPPQDLQNPNSEPSELQPMPAQPAPRESILPPRRGTPPPSGNVFNRRNCDDETDKCNLARLRLQSSPVQDISLDITPSIHPNAEGRQDELDRKRTTLARAPSRTWRSIDGEVLATGQLRDFRNSRVQVLTEEGDEVSIPFRDLSTTDACFVTAFWGLPYECRLSDERGTERNWMPSTFTWKASALCHKPLYFEEVQLERYGHSAGPLIQPALSGAHFFVNIAALPYNMGIHPPTECQYPLGHYRVGNCAPWLLPPVPLSLRGALLEAGVWTGGVFLIP